jgi:hypothetical protein
MLQHSILALPVPAVSLVQQLAAPWVSGQHSCVLCTCPSMRLLRFAGLHPPCTLLVLLARIMLFVTCVLTLFAVLPVCVQAVRTATGIVTNQRNAILADVAPAKKVRQGTACSTRSSLWRCWPQPPARPVPAEAAAAGASTSLHTCRTSSTPS